MFTVHQIGLVEFASSTIWEAVPIFIHQQADISWMILAARKYAVISLQPYQKIIHGPVQIKIKSLSS